MYKKIIIVGGGTAGWMTAATLIKFFSETKITVIASPEEPVIGVGESTLGHINNWLSMLDIKDEDFMKACQATYKLSIRFENFGRIGDGGFHYPFGDPMIEGNVSGLNDWYFKKILYPDTHRMDYAECIYPSMALVSQNRLTDQDIFGRDWSFKKNAAYQFDAIQFGQWLKNKYCLPKGVKFIEEHIKTIEQDEEGIKSLNHKHKADLFIDCTGFKSLLLGQTLKEPFENFDYLPNNRAWAVQIPYRNRKNEFVNYTNCTAIKNGWVWSIPLWYRIGKGYVYSNKYVSDEEALEEFKQHLGNPTIQYYPILPPYVHKDKGEDGGDRWDPRWADKLTFKHIKFQGGFRKRTWIKNVCAVGLSAGFVEPLEGNGLFTVHENLHNLLRCLGRENTMSPVSQYIRDNYNYIVYKELKVFAEFVALHYALSTRNDTPYWRDIQQRTFPFDINSFSTNSEFQRAVIQKFELNRYSPYGGLNCIATGLGWDATDLPNLMKHSFANTRDEFKKMWSDPVRKLSLRAMDWKIKARTCPTSEEFTRKKIYDKDT